MDDFDKLPLKRVEISLTKFNEVAIPHHLDLLRQHKANILKYSGLGSWSSVRREQTSAGRVCSQLRALLGELSELRGRVRDRDRLAFDRLTHKARDDTLAAIVDYLETSPVNMSRAGAGGAGGAVAGSAVSTDSVGLVAHVHTATPDHDQDLDVPTLQLDDDVVQLQIDRDEAALREREQVLAGWSELQREVHALHAAWRVVHAAVLAQREHVHTSAARLDTAADNVQAATRDLAIAERLSVGVCTLGGAVAGLAVGGPLGLAAGAKAGALAALAGSAVGAFVGAAFGRRRRQQIDDTLAKDDARKRD